LTGTTTEDPKLYTVRQTAELLGLQPRTIRDYVRAGELVAVDVGAPGAKRPTLRLPVESLRAFLEARRTGKGEA
jgi:excisionase family DNA binding protein